jgi:hypothetical protein
VTVGVEAAVLTGEGVEVKMGVDVVTGVIVGVKVKLTDWVGVLEGVGLLVRQGTVKVTGVETEFDPEFQ